MTHRRPTIRLRLFPGPRSFACRVLLLALTLVMPRAALAVDGTWSLIPDLQGLTPPPRHGHTMIVDEAQSRLVVVGGYSSWSSNALDETWFGTLDQIPVFTPGPNSPGPGPLHGHCSVYDPVRLRLLNFDGVNPTAASALDVWALSLGPSPSWSQVPTANTPALRRQGASAIYDPVRDRVLLFGGHDGIGYRNDVLVWSPGPPASFSTLITTGSPPSPRDYASMIYDPLRDRVLLFGGNSGAVYQDLYALDLTANPPAWSTLSPAAPLPAPRLAASAIYDPIGDRMILFGGVTPSMYFGDTWALSLGGAPAWSKLSEAGGPSPRHSAAMVFDATHSRALLLGGEATGSSDQLWELSLTGPKGWTLLGHTSAVVDPVPSTHGLGFALDPVRRRVLGVGGVGMTRVPRQLRLDEKPIWTYPLVPGLLPNSLQGASLDYDPAADRFLVFGGATEVPAWTNTLWQFAPLSNPGWAPLPQVGPPSERNYHSTLIDPLRNRLVLFGGNQAGLPLDDLWWMDLATLQWTHVPNAGPWPSPRLAHRVVRDATMDRMLLYGGVGAGGVVSGELWALDLGSFTWTLLPIPGGPGPRHSHVMAVDPSRSRALLHGGYDGATTRSELYELALGPSPAWRVLSTSGPAPNRHGHGAAFDPVSDRLIVHAGYSSNEVGTTSMAWQFIAQDSPTPTLASLARFEAQPGRVLLTWQWTGAEGVVVTLQRREEGSGWSDLVQGTFSNGRVELVDETVEEGRRYAYRLAGVGDAAGSHSAESWVDVPSALQFVLRGFQPNPSEGDPVVSLVLPKRGTLRVQVFDLAGRRVVDRELRDAPAGPNRVELGPSRLRPGLYVIRATFEGQSRVARGVRVQ